MKSIKLEKAYFDNHLVVEQHSFVYSYTFPIFYYLNCIHCEYDVNQLSITHLTRLGQLAQKPFTLNFP
jgi:hypothetical protein